MLSRISRPLILDSEKVYKLSEVKEYVKSLDLVCTVNVDYNEIYVDYRINDPRRNRDSTAFIDRGYDPVLR